MLPRIYRLRKKKDFEHIFSKGRSLASKDFRIRFVKNSLEYSRFTVVIPNRVQKKAVTRNRIRRQIREIIRLKRVEIRESYDVVFFIQRDALEKSFLNLKESVHSLLKKANLEK